jgi:hypothetical protein
MSTANAPHNEIIASVGNAAGIIIGVSENRMWIEVFFDGDLMHSKTVNLPGDAIFDIYVEEITHKSTVYEHPRTMIFFSAPCNLEIRRAGNRVLVSGGAAREGESVA